MRIFPLLRFAFLFFFGRFFRFFVEMREKQLAFPVEKRYNVPTASSIGGNYTTLLYTISFKKSRKVKRKKKIFPDLHTVFLIIRFA